MSSCRNQSILNSIATDAVTHRHTGEFLEGSIKVFVGTMVVSSSSAIYKFI